MRRYIKSWLVAFILGLTLPLASAQLITTGGTVTDSDSQTWNNGTWSATPVQTISSGPLYYNGVPISMAMVSGSLDGTGTFSTSALYNTTSLTPAGAAYRFIICPNATATCATIVTPVITSDLSSILSAQVQAPRFLASSTARGYLDIEVLNKYVQGATYYNVTMLSSRTWNGTAWVDSGGSGSGTVQAAPQFRHYIQPNAGTVAVAGPSTTVTNAVDPIAQGIGNTDLFRTGGTGNDGVTNFQAMYPTGQAIIPPGSTDTEMQGIPPSGAAIFDRRGNSLVSMFHNNSGVIQCSPGFTLTYYSYCDNTVFDLPQAGNAQSVRFYKYAGRGFNMGGPGAGAFNPSTGGLYGSGWSYGAVENSQAEFWTRGIRQLHSYNVNDHGSGDLGGVFYAYIATDGGDQDGGAEGKVGYSIHLAESTSYIHATIVTGGTTGSNLLTSLNTSGQNNYTDGGYLIDVSKTPSSYGNISSYDSESVVSGGSTFGVMNVSGSATVSSAWGTFNTATNSLATGQYQNPVSQTLTITLGTSSPGSITPGAACVVGVFSEQVQVTAVGTPSGSPLTQSITFDTRYAWDAASTLIMQGGDCGKFTSISGASWRTSMQVIGALSSSKVVFGACSGGTCTNTAVPTDIFPTGSTMVAYPGAEIIGTFNGVLNTVELGYNDTAWVNSDAIEGPHPIAVNLRGTSLTMGQTTTVNGAKTDMHIDEWDGPAILSDVSSTFIDAPAVDFWSINGSGTGRLQNLLTINLIPTQFIFDFSPAPDAEAIIVNMPSSRFGYHVGGKWYFYSNITGYQSIDAANIPADSTTLGQIPIVTNNSTGPAGIHYNPVTMTGDCTLVSTGVITCTPHLTATTGVLAGTALTATCDSIAVTVTGAVVGHTVSVSSTTGVDIGGAFNIRASVTATNTVTVYVCGTGTPASLAYNISTY